MEKSGSNNSNPNRIVYFDILNILAILAVIALHCNSIVHGAPNNRAWYTSLIVECLAYFAVPLFCMLSGATLMKYRKRYDTKTFFIKRVLKVLIPFIFWALFMFIWKISINQINTGQLHGIQDWLNAFFASKEETTYYFMFIILGLYLTLPLLSILAKKENIKTLWLTVGLFFIFNAFIPNILKLFKITYNTDLSVQLAGYSIFLLLGYLLSTQDIKKKYRILIYIGAIIGILYRFITTVLLSQEKGVVDKTTWGYTSWHSILLACAIFLWVKNFNFEKIIKGRNRVYSILAKVSGCSFGIYLIHQFIMYYEKISFKLIQLPGNGEL